MSVYSHISVLSNLRTFYNPSTPRFVSPVAAARSFHSRNPSLQSRRHRCRHLCHRCHCCCRCCPGHSPSSQAPPAPTRVPAGTERVVTCVCSGRGGGQSNRGMMFDRTKYRGHRFTPRTALDTQQGADRRRSVVSVCASRICCSTCWRFPSCPPPLAGIGGVDAHGRVVDPSAAMAAALSA